MKKEDIIKGNKLIAKFMGLRTDELRKIGLSQDSIDKRAIRLGYHYNWSCLMTVLNKIALLGDGSGFEIHFKTGCTDSFGECYIFKANRPKGLLKIVDTPYYDKEDGSEKLIYTVYKTVVNFIKWYNKENKNESSD
jgi:hypothetical protein